MKTVILLAMLAGLFSPAHSADAPPRHAVQCHRTSVDNVMVCMDMVTMAPCTMLLDVTQNHVAAGRAIVSHGYVYLRGTFADVGLYEVNSYQMVHTTDGYFWSVGACSETLK